MSDTPESFRGSLPPSAQLYLELQDFRQGCDHQLEHSFEQEVEAGARTPRQLEASQARLEDLNERGRLVYELNRTPIEVDESLIPEANRVTPIQLSHHAGLYALSLSFSSNGEPVPLPHNLYDAEQHLEMAENMGSIVVPPGEGHPALISTADAATADLLTRYQGPTEPEEGMLPIEVRAYLEWANQNGITVPPLDERQVETARHIVRNLELDVEGTGYQLG
jgi:hypothetical protein